MGKEIEFFERLEAARLKRGHSPEEICVALKISYGTWQNWKRGGGQRRAQKELAERYIKEAEGIE